MEASLNLFKAALNGVLHSPTALFDTTPIGRILSRLSKDQDTYVSGISHRRQNFNFFVYSLDSQLANNLTQVSCSTVNHLCILIYRTVLNKFQLRHRDDWVSVLHIPTVRHHLCSYDCAILSHLDVLSSLLCRNKAIGFTSAIDSVRQLLW